MSPRRSTGTGSMRRPAARTVAHSSANEGDFERHRLRAAPYEHPAEQVERLREALRHDHPVWTDADAPDARQVAAQLVAQLDAATMIAVVECLVGGRSQGALARAQPRASREQLDVRCGRDEVDAPRGSRLFGMGCPRHGDVGHGRDDRCASRSHLQVALGVELVVGVGHDAARHLEVGRQLTRRGKARPGDEATVLDGRPEGAMEVPPQVTSPMLDLDQHVSRAPGPIRTALVDDRHDASDRSALVLSDRPRPERRMVEALAR